MAQATKSFRIAEETWSEVEVFAARQGISPSQFIKEAIYEKLSAAGAAQTLTEVEKLREELRSHRRQFSSAIKALLITVGSDKKLDRETAEQWVTQNLNIT